MSKVSCTKYARGGSGLGEKMTKCDKGKGIEQKVFLLISFDIVVEYIFVSVYFVVP